MPRLAVTTAVWLVGVALAGLVVRAIPVALADFPVNDGGLFVAMTRAIEAAGWRLPITISWNGSELPFAYPPLGFYLSGGLSSVFGLELTDVFRWLPLGRQRAGRARRVPARPRAPALRRRRLVAALAYALAPVSYVWLVQGGGVTRAPGMLLAVLTIWQVVRLIRVSGRRTAVVVGVLAGLTALVHPGAAIFAAVSSVLLWLFEGRTVASVRVALVSVAIALLIAAPWLVITVSRHGLGTILAVPSNGPEPAAAILAVLAGRVTGTAWFDPLAIAGLVVAIVWLVRRQFLLPIWFGVATLLSYPVRDGSLRSADRFGGSVPRARLTPTAVGAARMAPLVSLVVLAVALVFEAGASVLAVQNPGAPLHALSSGAAGGNGVGGCQPGTGGRTGGDHEQRVVRRPGLRVVLSPRRAPLGGHRAGLGMAGRGGL